MPQSRVRIKTHFDCWDTTIASHVPKRVCEIFSYFVHVSKANPKGGSILSTVKPSRQPGAEGSPQVLFLHEFTGDLCNLWLKRLYCGRSEFYAQASLKSSTYREKPSGSAG